MLVLQGENLWLTFSFCLSSLFCFCFVPFCLCRLEPNTRITNALGSTATALEVLAGEKLRHFIFNYMTELFAKEKLHAILTPTIGVDVPILSDEAKVRGETNTAMSLLMTKYMFMANFIGLPGYSVPIGYVPAKSVYMNEPKDLKLPVGLQILGDHWSEHKVDSFSLFSPFSNIFFIF
jgi:Asp-tRNA(Asn)/Glu-tRNA(Gln) amidotransferase A subunit family amidase